MHLLEIYFIFMRVNGLKNEVNFGKENSIYQWIKKTKVSPKHVSNSLNPMKMYLILLIFLTFFPQTCLFLYLPTDPKSC